MNAQAMGYGFFHKALRDLSTSGLKVLWHARPSLVCVHVYANNHWYIVTFHITLTDDKATAKLSTEFPLVRSFNDRDMAEDGTLVTTDEVIPDIVKSITQIVLDCQEYPFI